MRGKNEDVLIYANILWAPKLKFDTKKHINDLRTACCGSLQGSYVIAAFEDQ